MERKIKVTPPPKRINLYITNLFILFSSHTHIQALHIMDSKTVGILGGGQLGRMIVEAAHRLNIKTVILDAAKSPAKQINALDDHVDGSFKL